MHVHWRLGGGANREIDFGFGCGACVCACVRAKLCAGVRQMFLLGLGPRSRSLWGSAPGRAGPGRRALPGGRGGVKKRVSFLRNLIASGYSATPEVCFCRVFVPKISCFVFIEHDFLKNRKKKCDS